jgi:hypothetical protein
MHVHLPLVQVKSWRIPFSGVWRCVVLVWTNVLEERIASIFRVEKSASKVTVWAGGCSHIAENSILHSHRCENLKSYKCNLAVRPFLTNLQEKYSMCTLITIQCLQYVDLDLKYSMPKVPNTTDELILGLRCSLPVKWHQSVLKHIKNDTAHLQPTVYKTWCQYFFHFAYQQLFYLRICYSKSCRKQK